MLFIRPARTSFWACSTQSQQTIFENLPVPCSWRSFIRGLPRTMVGRPHFINPAEAHYHLSHLSQSSRLCPSHVRPFAGILYPQQVFSPSTMQMRPFFKWDHDGWALSWQLTGHLSNIKCMHVAWHLDTLGPNVVNKWDRSVSLLPAASTSRSSGHLKELGFSICLALALGSEKRQLAHAKEIWLCLLPKLLWLKKKDIFPSQPFKNFYLLNFLEPGPRKQISAGTIGDLIMHHISKMYHALWERNPSFT